MGRDHKTKIVREAVRRWRHLPTRAIARYIQMNYGQLFGEEENDLEKIRKRISRIRGRNGASDREKIADKSLYLTPDEELRIPPTWSKKRTPHKLQPGLWLVLSDIHIPYHRPLPIEAAIQYGQSQRVTGLFINGDLQDCASIGYWLVEKRDFPKEMEATIDMLDFLRKEFSDLPIIYKPGNHEYRLPRYYMAQKPELIETPLSAMETLLGFEERDIEFLDFYQKVIAGDLPIIHGHEVQNLNRTVNPARGLFLRAKTFSACSHCHTTSEHSTRDINDLMITTWSFGCLCDLSPDWNPIGNDWNWGFALINVEKDNNFEVENRRILSSGRVV